MKKHMILAGLMLSMAVWAGAQQPSSMPSQSGAQATTPSAGVPQAGAPGADTTAPQAAPQSSATSAGAGANGAITEGCLGGSNPNFTLTDKGGKSYSLVLPQGADGAKLTPHVGESIQVMGDVTGSSINVSKVGKGNGTCAGK